MNGNSILLGRVFGIPIRVHFFLLLALPYAMTFFSTPSMPMRLLGAIGLFASVALHELGHSIVAQAKGSYIQEIVLYPFGGAAKIANIPKRPMDEILVALAGPAVSLLLGIAGFLIGGLQLGASPNTTHYPLILELGAINIVLCIFNLLPVFPMDGGRVLRALLSKRRSRLEATRIAVTVGKYFCIFFIVYGLLKAQPFLAFIGGYIYFVGRMEYRMVRMEHQSSHYSGDLKENIGVEVSPPPYAENGHENGSLAEKIRKLFRLG